MKHGQEVPKEPSLREELPEWYRNDPHLYLGMTMTMSEYQLMFPCTCPEDPGHCLCEAGN